MAWSTCSGARDATKPAGRAASRSTRNQPLMYRAETLLSRLPKGVWEGEGSDQREVMLLCRGVLNRGGNERKKGC